LRVCSCGSTPCASFTNLPAVYPTVYRTELCFVGSTGRSRKSIVHGFQGGLRRLPPLQGGELPERTVLIKAGEGGGFPSPSASPSMGIPTMVRCMGVMPGKMWCFLPGAVVHRISPYCLCGRGGVGAIISTGWRWECPPRESHRKFPAKYVAAQGIRRDPDDGRGDYRDGYGRDLATWAAWCADGFRCPGKTPVRALFVGQSPIWLILRGSTIKVL